MEKLELKHLAPYLPYGLKIKTKGGIVKLLAFDINLWESNKLELKPILRPLSDLTDEQKKIIYFDVIGTDNDMYGTLDEFIDYLGETNEYHLPYCIYRQLLEWHFDLFGLIEKGLAVDINSL